MGFPSAVDISGFTRLKPAFAQLRYLPRAFGLVWAAAGRWTVAWSALLIVQGLLPAVIVSLTRPLVNSLAAAAGPGGLWAHAGPTLLLAAGLAATILLAELLQSAG